ncbi:MAG TPA: peptidase M50 [Firmicutes bacterium]|nr:peptidase M50 [Bacillota bacterium]
MQVGRVFGVRILVNKFFLLLLFLYGLLGLIPQVLTVFAACFIHELAHVLVANSYGYRVKEIELLPFGGVARIEDLDLAAFDPEVELNIALAGPLQNLILAGIGLVLRHFLVWQESLAVFFIYCNLGMALLNLLPVLPLDGGRLCRAYLVRRLGYRQATERVAGWGRLVGILLLAIGLLGILFSWLSITVLFVALFIFWAARREQVAAAYIFFRFLTRKQRELRDKGLLPIEGLMATESTSLREVVRKFVPRRYHLVFLQDSAGKMGFLTEGEIVTALLERGLDATLGEILQRRW